MEHSTVPAIGGHWTLLEIVRTWKHTYGIPWQALFVLSATKAVPPSFQSQHQITYGSVLDPKRPSNHRF